MLLPVMNTVSFSQVKLLEPHGRIVEFIRKAIDPPLDLAVRNAVMLLQDLGALTPDERLTELGKQLGSLPVHPSTSKMLLVAILLNCLDPALTVACAAGYREPFVLPMAPDQKKRASAARQELAEIYGGYSDHLAVVAAFDRWEAAKTNSQEKQFCSQYFISGKHAYFWDILPNRLKSSRLDIWLKWIHHAWVLSEDEVA